MNQLGLMALVLLPH